MADNIENQPAVEVSPADAAKAELASQMAFALNINNPQAQAAAVEKPQEQATVETTVVENPAPASGFEVFKEKFGYQTPEEALAEIEQLRALKAAPPEFQYENADSKLLHEAILAGKTKEVLQILNRQDQIERLMGVDVNDISAAEIVKMGMQLKYKDLTPAEIDYKFKKQFAMPAKPAQGVDEDQADYEQRVAEWQSIVDDKKMELMIEAKLARPELEAAKPKLVLPQIENQVDDGYAQYQKMMEQQATIDAETKAAYKKLTADNVVTKVNFNDEANKIAFEFNYKPDAAAFQKAVDIASDSEQFWKLFLNPDGSPNRTLFLDAILYATNKEAILMEAMKQSKNATIKSTLPDNSQGGGLVRQLNADPGEPSELDKAMRQALGKHWR